MLFDILNYSKIPKWNSIFIVFHVMSKLHDWNTPWFVCILHGQAQAISLLIESTNQWDRRYQSHALQKEFQWDGKLAGAIVEYIWDIADLNERTIYKRFQVVFAAAFQCFIKLSWLTCLRKVFADYCQNINCQFRNLFRYTWATK